MFDSPVNRKCSFLGKLQANYKVYKLVSIVSKHDNSAAMDVQFFALVFLLALVEARAQFKPAQPCDPEKCLPPNCRCSEDRKPPGGLTPKETPQIIMVTFDDGIEQRFYDLYIELLEELQNPNGCPAVGTLFNCHVGTNYFLVETAYSQGFEIADHTVTHQGATHYENANYTVWKNDIDGQREILHRFANIPYDEVTGFRAPDLMFTENMFKVLYTSNFTYDLSWPVDANFDGLDAMYPYTLDYLSTEPCPTQEEPCPKMSYPGLWEIPNINIMNEDNTTCASMLDGCDPAGNATAWYDRLIYNFHQYHYDTNRAPFGMHMHVTFFLSALGSDHMVAAKKFLKYAEDLDDVWILTPSQVIAWMKDPQNIEQAKSFAPWKCPERPKPRCDSSTVNGCHYTVKGEQVYMFTCTKCPPHYPTPTNPDGN